MACQDAGTKTSRKWRNRWSRAIASTPCVCRSPNPCTAELPIIITFILKMRHDCQGRLQLYSAIVEIIKNKCLSMFKVSLTDGTRYLGATAEGRERAASCRRCRGAAIVIGKHKREKERGLRGGPGISTGRLFREFTHCLRVGEAGHARLHQSEPQLPIEAFHPGRWLEDQITVRKSLRNGLNDDLSDSLALGLGNDGHVVNGPLVLAIGQGSSEADQPRLRINENRRVTRLESAPVNLRFMIRHPDEFERVRDGLPIDSGTICFYV